jgi:PhzF family phenazine biosynthesis protein
MRLPLYQVDAFSGRVFAGNPAAVCPLQDWLPEHTMQSIAAENNLAETAFFVRRNGHFELRWFTPACEVDLCGHATLASAYVLFRVLNEPGAALRFQTKSGLLEVRREGELLVLNFPARPPQAATANPGLVEALGGSPLEVLSARDYLVRYGSEEEVLALAPDFAAVARTAPFGAIVTAPGKDVDFVSRFFAPAKGVPEDPVTGSAHCTLIPYWAAQLGKNELRARQVSKRTGELLCRMLGDRVEMAGRATLYLTGEIEI